MTNADAVTAPVDTANRFFVARQGNRVVFLRPVPPVLSDEDALLLAAYLVTIVGDDPRWDVVRKAVEQC